VFASCRHDGMVDGVMTVHDFCDLDQRLLPDDVYGICDIYKRTFSYIDIRFNISFQHPFGMWDTDAVIKFE